MASIDKRKGSWRAQVRRGGRSLIKTFRMKADADAWALSSDTAFTQAATSGRRRPPYAEESDPRANVSAG